MNGETVLRRNARVVHRRLGAGDGGVLLHLDTAAYHGLNDVGTVVWELLEEPCTLDDLVAGVRERFADAPDSVGDDVTAFVHDLVTRDLLTAT